VSVSGLVVPEMIQLSTPMITPGTRAHSVISSVPSALAVLPHVETAHAGLLALETGADVDGLLQAVQVNVHEHDRLVRAIDLRILAQAQIASSEEEKVALVHAHDAILPDGQAIIRTGATQKAGEARMRARRVTPGVLALLGTVPTSGTRTAADLYADLQRTADAIGTADTRRQTALAEIAGPRVREARKSWVQAIHLLEAVFQTAKVDDTAVFGPLRAISKKNGAAEDDVTNVVDPVAPTPSA
jgi:hypothetical protein